MNAKRKLRPACSGTGAMITGKMRKIVWSYQSVDGKRHDFVNCPVCSKDLKAPNDFVVRHVAC